MKKVRKLIAIYLVLTLLSGVLSVSVFATAAGTEEDPLLVEPNPMIENMYLMNDSLEAGDADGIWYELTIHSDGILAVSVNCKADVAYDVEVYAGDYVGLASKGSPVITYCVTAGDTVIVHKFVRADESGHRGKAPLSGAESFLCQDRDSFDAGQRVLQVYSCFHYIRGISGEDGHL